MVQGQELQQEALPLLEVPPQEVQQQEVLLRGQEVLLVLEKAQVQVRALEALLRAQAGVLAVVEEQVLELALAVGLRQVVLERGQVELVRVKE